MNLTQPISAPLARIEGRILFIRGLRVMIDADLAELYGVSTKALNQAVKRNTRRFPQDFMFQLTPVEKLEVVTGCDHLTKLKFSKSLPLAFTEHGAIQVAKVLSSEQAVEMGVYVVRAFVHLREMTTTNKELALRLNELENKTDLMSLKSDTFELSPPALTRQRGGISDQGCALHFAWIVGDGPGLEYRGQPGLSKSRSSYLRSQARAALRSTSSAH